MVAGIGLGVFNIAKPALSPFSCFSDLLNIYSILTRLAKHALFPLLFQSIAVYLVVGFY